MEVYGCLEQTSIMQHHVIQLIKVKKWKMEVLIKIYGLEDMQKTQGHSRLNANDLV